MPFEPEHCEVQHPTLARRGMWFEGLASVYFGHQWEPKKDGIDIASYVGEHESIPAGRCLSCPQGILEYDVGSSELISNPSCKEPQALQTDIHIFGLSLGVGLRLRCDLPA